MNKLLAAILSVLFLALASGAQEVYVDNVVVVLDASGSMKSPLPGTNVRKIDAAKTAIKEVMKTIPQSTRVGLLVFSDTSQGWVYPLGFKNDAELFAAVDKVRASGGTPLGEYMKIGTDRLLEVRSDQYGYGSYRLLIVTDGEANDGNLVEAYTPDIISRGITMDVIGVDMTQAHTLATKVHSYRRANDPAALKQAIQEVFAEVGKGDVDQSGETAFEELAGFPQELALPTIQALISSGNHRIGEDPGSDTAEQSAQPGSSTTKKKESAWSSWVVMLIIAGFFIVKILGKSMRR